MRRTLVPLLSVAALLLGLVARQATASPVGDLPMATVTVPYCGSAETTVPVDYLGLSIEWSMVQPWFGTRGRTAVHSTVAMLKSLQGPGGTGVLRIGGNSQDAYNWVPDGSLYGNLAFAGTINSGLVDAALAVARESGWKIVFGVNLRSDRPADAVSFVRYVQEHDAGHNVLAYAVGNEPNAYFGTDTTGYVTRFTAFANALNADPVTREAPIAGPGLSNEADLSYITQLQASFGSRLRFVTWHHYGNRPTLAGLLEDSVTSRWTNRIAEVAKAAGGATTRMDEGNSVGNGGLDGVSNVMGSTAWLMDTLLSGAAAGLGGYNLHSWDGYYYPTAHRTAWYTPFVVRRREVIPRPGFYALALLRDLAGKRFCTSETVLKSGADVKAWALTDPATRTLYVYLVEKGGPGHEGSVTVTPPVGYSGNASVSQISDPDGCSGRDTTINGSALPGDVHFSWSARPVSPTPGAAGYDIPVDSCQSTLVTIPAG